MKPLALIALIALPLSLLACVPEQQPAGEEGGRMIISRSNERRPTPGPAEYFTGAATITPLFDAKGRSQVGAALVRFEPGARTAWHSHPLGQRLVVTEGAGWTQVEGGPVEGFRAGDVVWCPPQVRHWHGATPDTATAHIAIQESQNGSPLTWREHVTEEQYFAGPPPGSTRRK
jgi:quercetin dioxygenase-like cupin family protein